MDQSSRSGTHAEVAVVGTLNLDATIRVDRLPARGETVTGDTVAVAPGGKGSNQAVAAARMGARTALVGCVGADGAGDQVLAALDAEPLLDATAIRRVAVPTGTAHITIDAAGENTIVTARGANAALDEHHVHRHGTMIARAAVVVVQLGVPVDAIRAVLDIARGVGTLVLLDPAPADEVTDDMLRSVDVCTPNETEAERLTGISVQDDAGVRRAAAALLARGCGAVVLTLGERGAHLAMTGGAEHTFAAPEVGVVDPTGAGDALCGALAAALAHGACLEDAVRDAVVAGALAVTRLGAVPSLPDRAEVEAARRDADG